MNFRKENARHYAYFHFRIMFLIMVITTATSAKAKSWLVQAELAPTTSGWQVQRESNASGGALLGGGAQDALGESGGLKVLFPAAGKYWIWVRYRRAADGAYGSFYTLVRTQTGEVIAMQKMDWAPRLPTESPYEPFQSEARRNTRENDFIWERFPIIAEYPFAGTLHFGGIAHGGKVAPRRIDCAIVTDEENFYPNKVDWEKLPPVPEKFDFKTTIPKGLHPAQGFPMNSAFFAGIADPRHQFHMGLGYNAAVYQDDASFIQLGFNRTHGNGRGSAAYGVWTMASANFYEKMDAAQAKQYPAPEGRFVNSAGEVGKSWSFFFPPLRDGLRAVTETSIASSVNDPAVESWRIIAESGGYMDYSDPARIAFGQWLAERYKDIDRLNALWGTSYKNFDAVQPPKDAQENLAAWFAFREFNGQALAETVHRQAEIIRQLDPRHRELTEQLSNLDLLAARFKNMRPIDWEQFINVALKDVENVGWDAYAVDDYIGAEIDLVRSLAPGKTLFNEEWNTHGTDPRVAARTLWGMIGKGLRGVHLFQWQEGTFHDSYPKWALLNHDFTPKAKFGAMADIAQEVHRLEPLLMSAKPLHAVKPVALYYSELDLSLSKPLASAWGEPVDTPYHVYATLRGMGYPVRWITPRQIDAGELDDVAAVVLIDAQHIPQSAAQKLADWVHGGGAEIADRWPGAFDEYGRPQNTLSPVFGIRAKETTKAKNELALQESSQGYGEVTINALSGDDLPSTVGELWQQWDSTHPVGKKMGDFMLAGYGLTHIKSTSGQVIGMTFGGDPGVVINAYGKGQAMYVAMMLGSLYESSAVRYEWDSTHSGSAYYRLLDEFLRFSGAHPSAVPDLPLRLRAKLRVETPLVDPAGNALFALTSMNDEPLPAFNLKLQWPGKLAAPKVLLVAIGGSRALRQVPFTIKENTLTLQMLAFDSHAEILALTKADPMVSLDISGAKRGVADMLMLYPNETLQITATVHNPSSATIPAGDVKLWAPDGWFIDASQKKCPAIKPWGSVKVRFTARTPVTGGPARLRPIVVKHEANGKTSAPATEEVWWNRPAGDPF